ncbi:HypC/HybG/HupF family hydrogenase formation chaperone [Corynebacterium amycolatum]|uniref:HypC/HybG/HupF family hydrogenase formation chaperone n=1 Tax=Corynebacterium amycolatum TaxID=43765 RepID=A0AB37GGG6_CORAY|nr:HypC/HybG/HupF family hydrogenase formation chaperone [Corynebacterium amycolatum]MCQ9125904.1 HypC/HybG/HupF family hydrogenase formation chaperone [Corynebacterium amycolatum]MCQ9166951.1 HypC/HybG/HupF family hydrogenase formation chaperone [Corynebacterium amycolatum]MCQ9168648.1 HypC/HybG/HupF family hydrogenase formation chaperone [Corynebacterium amycolatum]MCQ9173489.1 HypC/HybG/HupF family hydrogenase formation chaperone [Corynebacterium amycolatum]MCQ9176020.1 HypC/HybG/HupF famil
MCLGIPAKVLAIADGPLPMAMVDMAGQKRQCSAMYVPELVVGDWVFVQNGFIMNVLDEQEAKDSLAAIEENDLIEHVAEVSPKRRT